MSNSMSEYPGQDEFLNGYREAPAQQREATEQPELAASKKRKSAPETEVSNARPCSCSNTSI
jgi:hypothetical protein